MANKKIILIISINLTLILSCTKELKENEINWNPYVVNEVIVFESSEKELDSILITEINDNIISSGPTPELYRYKSLWVYAKRLKSQSKLFSTKKILDISAGTPTPDKATEIAFDLFFENANFAGWGLNIEELNEYPTMSVTTKAGTFTDVIKIESIKYRPERENSVLYMYWSKKNGYIKFERGDGLTWELIKKYVP